MGIKVEVKKIIKRIKNGLVVALTSIGISVVGHALLTDGNQPKEPESKTEIENDGDTKSRKETYLQELQDMSQYDNQKIVQEYSNIPTVDQTFKEYNENLLEQAKIEIKDLGIIWQKDFENSEKKLIRETDENGDTSYIENISKKTEDLQEGQKWAEEEKVRDIYVLVDTKHNCPVAGIGVIDDKCYEIEIEKIRGANRIEYIKNDATYVGLPEECDEEKAYEDFSEYYKKRIKEQEKNDGIEY